jgi:hypothetical protein
MNGMQERAVNSYQEYLNLSMPFHLAYGPRFDIHFMREIWEHQKLSVKEREAWYEELAIRFYEPLNSEWQRLKHFIMQYDDPELWWEQHTEAVRQDLAKVHELLFEENE